MTCSPVFGFPEGPAPVGPARATGGGYVASYLVATGDAGFCHF